MHKFTTFSLVEFENQTEFTWWRKRSNKQRNQSMKGLIAVKHEMHNDAKDVRVEECNAAVTAQAMMCAKQKTENPLLDHSNSNTCQSC